MLVRPLSDPKPFPKPVVHLVEFGEKMEVKRGGAKKNMSRLDKMKKEVLDKMCDRFELTLSSSLVPLLC